MSTRANGGRNTNELGGRIVVGYGGNGNGLPSNRGGGGCVREMVADEYVGSVRDADRSDGVIRNGSVTLLDGRTFLEFTTYLHAGQTAADLSWHLKGFGNQRIMWATGEVGGSGACDAPLQYHGGARGLASLNFPGFGSACILEEVKEEETGNGGHGRDVGINR
jgi:hypothetical protein